jgi:hypothetical protein
MAYAPELTGCTAVVCLFENQLVELNRLDSMGNDGGSAGQWFYYDAIRRVNQQFMSINTGEILLLANTRGGRFDDLEEGVRGGFQFGEMGRAGKGYRSQHGGLTLADSMIPVAFGSPGATRPAAPDDLMGTLRAMLQGYAAAELVNEPIETPAIISFFDLAR